MKEIHLITKNTNEFTLGISIENIENCTPDVNFPEWLKYLARP